MDNIKKAEKILKALANQRRIAILEFLQRWKEANVGEIASHIRLSFKSTSRHLAVLRSAEIVETRQENLNIFYKVNQKAAEFIRFILKSF